MPIYPYRCTECGHRFEKIQKFGAKPEEICPQCGGALERPLTAPGLQFKGAGWYVNDYAAKSSGNAAEKSAPAENKPTAESKPDAASGASSAAAPASAPAAAAATASTASSN